jgi:hypothetical protein|tara:strand:- start:1796 stop:2206 length:411 start_codon:yes stop_codon:yes gene_type:complete
MNSLRENYILVNKISQKYGDAASDDELKGWLTICLLSDDFDVMSMSFESFIVTYVVKSEIFNVIKLRDDHRTDKDKTILLAEHMIKNFGINTLNELRRKTVCSVCDMCSLIDDIESDIRDFANIDTLWNDLSITNS